MKTNICFVFYYAALIDFRLSGFDATAASRIVSDTKAILKFNMSGRSIQTDKFL